MHPEWGIIFSLELRPPIVKTPVIYMATMYVPQGPEFPSRRYPSCCLPRRSLLQPVRSEQFLYPHLQYCPYAVIRTARVCSKAWRPSSAFF
jgi:hypothetical protein